MDALPSILVVDDDRDIRETLADVLADDGRAVGDPISDLGMTLAYWFELGETEMVGPAAFGPPGDPDI